MDKAIPFVRHEKTLRDIALRDLAQGTDHSGIEARFGDLLVIADRFLESCTSTTDHGDLPRRMTNALDEIASNSATVGTDLLTNCLEAWFKGVLQRVNPDLYSKRKASGARFNLYQVIGDLELLSDVEIELSVEDAAQISDPVRRCMLLAKEHRNAPTHSAISIDPYGPELRAGMVAILASIDRHRLALRTCLRGLIVGTLPNAHLDLIHRIRSEREHRLNGFVGRSEILNDLRGLIEQMSSKGGYLVLTAPEGFGKSAVAAKITDCADDVELTLGDSRLQTTRDAPWLPRALLHMGKQSRDPVEFVSGLVAQANTLLLHKVEPIAIDDADTRGFSASREGADSEQQDVERKRAQTLAYRVRAKLHELLERLRDERGQSLLVIDALDEIGHEAGNFDFLPEILPAGSVILMTTRPEGKLIEMLSRRLRAKRIVLGGLSIDEVKELTGVDDARWVGDLHRFSRGAPLYVSIVARQVKEGGSNYKRIDPPASMRAIFLSQASLWRTANVQENRDALHAILGLLSVFEPVAPIEMDLLQDFLRVREMSFSGRALREILAGVATQIEGLDSGKVRLAVKAFGEYVRESLFTKQDLRDLIKDVSEWLAVSKDVTGALLTAYLRSWTDPETVNDPRLRSSAEELVGRLVINDRADLVADIYSRWSRGDLREEETPEFLLSGLHRAAGVGSAAAMFSLGKIADKSSIYGIANRDEEARKWFSKAAEGGHPDAMVFIGRFLLDGRGGDKLPVAGEEWLRRAIALGEVSARVELAERYLDGRDLPCDLELGERLLREAAAESAFARFELGNRLIDGKGLPPNPEEGEQMLESAGLELPFASLMLADRLLDGDGLARNSLKGEALIRSLAETQSFAKSALATRLLKGNGILCDPHEGERLLREASAEDPFAKVRLANYLLDGKLCSNDPSEGLRLLEDVSACDPYAKVSFAARLLAGKGIPQDIAKGKQLLQQSTSDAKRLSIVRIDSTAFEYYAEARNAKDFAVKSRLQWAAAFLFFTALKVGISSDPGNNLAYIMRRGEARDTSFPSLDTLLESGLKSRLPFPIVNQALREAAGCDCAVDWKAGDERIASLSQADAADVINWWHGLAKAEDPEGHLVIGWLSRHALVTDPDGLDLAARLNRARVAWDMPEWMYEKPLPA
jgi:TPR repeat protein